MFCFDNFYQENTNFWQSLKGGTFFSGQFERKTASGETIYLEATYNPVVAAAIPVAAGLGAHQPDWRLRLAAEPQAGGREVQAATIARKTLAYDFFRILRAPHKGRITRRVGAAGAAIPRGLWR